MPPITPGDGCRQPASWHRTNLPQDGDPALQHLIRIDTGAGNDTPIVRDAGDARQLPVLGEDGGREQATEIFAAPVLPPDAGAGVALLARCTDDDAAIVVDVVRLRHAVQLLRRSRSPAEDAHLSVVVDAGPHHDRTVLADQRG